MQIELRSLASVAPYDKNPRVNDGAAVEAVARSIQAFGFRQPIVVDKDGVIVVGQLPVRGQVLSASARRLGNGA